MGTTPEGTGKGKHDPGEYERMRQRSEEVLGDLLAPENRTALERYRFSGSSNRVYKIPLGQDDRELVIVKLLPGRMRNWSGWLKAAVRNLLYDERGMAVRGGRVDMEIERYREWERAGMPIPRLIEVSKPDVRVVQWLPYPTLYSLLRSSDISGDDKVAIVATATRALSAQHRTALERGSKGLIHPHPGPWNMLFDQDSGTIYWYDLEHPGEYRSMSFHSLMVRGVRIFTNGVLNPLEDRSAEVVRTIVANYEQRDVLQGVVAQALRSPAARVLQLTQLGRIGRRRYRRQRRLATELGEALRAGVGR